MANSYHHAVSSAKKFGGKPEDYQEIHDWFDQSKSSLPDARHRAMLHHTHGIFVCEQMFGHAIKNSDGKMIPVRFIAEQHVIEDMGRIPTLQDWFSEMPIKSWMHRHAESLSKTL